MWFSVSARFRQASRAPWQPSNDYNHNNNNNNSYH